MILFAEEEGIMALKSSRKMVRRYSATSLRSRTEILREQKSHYYISQCLNIRFRYHEVGIEASVKDAQVFKKNVQI